VRSSENVEQRGAGRLKTRRAPSLIRPQDADKQTAIKVLTLSFDECAKNLQAMPPGQWEKEVYRFKGQPVTAGETLWYTFTHMAHHRGQAEVYLRVKNIKPPAWRF